jgi:ATP-dependent RNA helicase DDX52/ROK1
MGFKNPTPIQMQAIPVLCNSRELLVSAPTGSGKTLSYALPILQNLNEPGKEGFRALILAPTRVLAKQITKDFEIIGKGKNWKIVHVEKNALKMKERFTSKKNDIIISTPQRLIVLIREKYVDLSR